MVVLILVVRMYNLKGIGNGQMEKRLIIQTGVQMNQVILGEENILDKFIHQVFGMIVEITLFQIII